MQPLKSQPGTSSYAVEIAEIRREAMEARGQVGPGSIEKLQRALTRETDLLRKAWRTPS